MSRLRKLSPWVTYYKELDVFFKEDPQVKVVYDEEENEVKLYVDNTTKANALAELLPAEETWGNVTLRITVIPSNRRLGATQYAQPILAALNGNKAVSFTTIIDGISSNPLTYIVFVNEVVQYFSDDLGDIYGQTSTLYQEIAKNIFGNIDGVYFCTDKPDTFAGYAISGNAICRSSN